MELDSISIRQLQQQMSGHATCYRDDIIISNHVERLEPFRNPCRISATLVLFCLDGEIDFSVNLRRYHIGRDMMAVAFAGDIVQVHHAKALEAYAVLLSPEYLDDLQIDFRQRSKFYLGLRRNSIVNIPHVELMAMAPYYALLKTNMEKLRAEIPEILRGLIRAFSYTVISLINIYRRDVEDTFVAPRSQHLFDKFMALLRLHHNEERNANFYADRLCLTTNYLSKMIKGYSGKTMTEWINEYIMLEARVMLRNTDLSIQEIAYRLKFPTQSAFGKYFRLQTGIGPQQYRCGQEETV